MELYEVISVVVVVLAIALALILVNIMTLWVALRMMTSRKMTKRFGKMYKKLMASMCDSVNESMKKLE